MNTDPTTHAAWNEKNDADTAAESAEIAALDADYFKARASKLEAHKIAQVRREQRFASWCARETATMVAQLGAKDGLYAACAAFGGNPRGDATKIAQRWNALHSRCVEALNSRPHQWHLLFSLSGGDERLGHPDFFTCDTSARSCAKAERVTQRIVDGAGSLELVQSLLDLGATLEVELRAIPAHHLDARILARTDAARKAIAFHDVLRAVRAVDERAEAAHDERSGAEHAEYLARTNYSRIA